MRCRINAGTSNENWLTRNHFSNALKICLEIKKYISKDLKTREKSLKQTIAVLEKEFKEKDKKLTTLQQQVEQTLEKLEKVKSHIPIIEIG